MEKLVVKGNRRTGPPTQTEVIAQAKRKALKDLDTVISADEEENKLLESNATRFLQVALTNYRRYVLTTGHHCTAVCGQPCTVYFVHAGLQCTGIVWSHLA